MPIRPVTRFLGQSFQNTISRKPAQPKRKRFLDDGRKMPGLALLAGVSLAMVACQSANIGTATDGISTQKPVVATLSPNPQGEVFGQGNVRLALLLPKSAPGNAATVARDLRNGALLAMQDFGQNRVQLVIKDTKGTAAEAQAVASQAISEGSTAVLGPLFSGSVNAVSAVTLPAGRTMIAFSNDPSVAKRGVYLLSYTQTADTRRMISHAISQGRRSIYAFLPTGAVGVLQEAALRETAGRYGANVQVVKYERSGPGIEAASRQAVIPLQNSDAIYIPEGGQIPKVILSSLQRAGANIAGKQVLGSGQWESVKFDSNLLEGAIYTGRDITNFNAFSSRYQSTYNSQPGLFAGLAYDAVTLAINLVASKGPQQAFQPSVLEDRRGFSGINGIFRLRSDGTAERGLAVYKVLNGQGVLETRAPTSFSGS